MIICPDDYMFTPEGEYLWTPERAAKAWEEANKAFREALLYKKFKRVVLIMGAPGSGKSTWLKKYKIEDVLYFDAVFKSWKTREPYLRLAWQAGYYPEVVWMRTPLEVCLERNSQRPPNRKVPEDHLRGKWESIRNFPPNPGREGFLLIVQ